MMDLKQEMDRAGERIECVEYRVTERTDEIDENLQTRVREIRKFKYFYWLILSIFLKYRSQSID